MSEIEQLPCFWMSPTPVPVQVVPNTSIWWQYTKSCSIPASAK
uniref:Uncharacterized protein n=1 Tax=Arundo donax TaxID=35708 RepID=A0A0A9HWS2_ARUDO